MKEIVNNSEDSKFSELSECSLLDSENGRASTGYERVLRDCVFDGNGGSKREKWGIKDC